jgi:hypothetical protein
LLKEDNVKDSKQELSALSDSFGNQLKESLGPLKESMLQLITQQQQILSVFVAWAALQQKPAAAARDEPPK